MTYYGPQQLADAFRTVRKNTITIAEEIPAEQYGYRAAPGIRTVGEMLAHIAVITAWQVSLHGEGISFVDFEYFGRSVARAAIDEQALTTKDDIVAALRANGEAFAAFLEGLDEATLAQTVGFPPPVQPAVKTRFEMLLGVKEHEMHHRGQLMLIERQLGITPHITRQREAFTAQPARS